MTIGLIIVLLIIFILPFAVRSVEHNLEYFLLVMGIVATLISKTLSLQLLIHIFENYLLYFITGAVLVAGLVFRLSVTKIKDFVNYVIKHIPLTVFAFLLVVILGMISSVITAIIASLILVEIVHVLPINRDRKVLLTVVTCFSIGLGAALTPLGEPLATIVVSKLKVDFLYLFRIIGLYIIPCIILLGLIGAFLMRGQLISKANKEEISEIDSDTVVKVETLKDVFIRAIKIFLFIIALELLGAGFKPLINTYVIQLDSRILYWINLSSAVLDNATLAAAEVSPTMNLQQIQAILMGLLISGGMLIPGNIPNIISAGKLGIKSREWAKIGVTIGSILLIIYFVIIFII